MYTNTFNIDSDIVLRLKNGDETAFRVIYDRYYSQVYSFIYSFLKQKQQSEEVLQETFLAIWLQHDVLDAAKPIEPLLFTICRRKILDNFRKITSTEKLKKQLILYMTEFVNSTEETVLLNDVISFTNDTIDKLPKQQQLVFRLSRIEGLSHDEIAEQLKLSKNTVKNHLVAALKTLRGKFKEQDILYLFALFLFR